MSNAWKQKEKIMKVTYRVGIVRPHGYRTMPYLALFTDDYIRAHENNELLFGGWASEPITVKLPKLKPSYVGGPPLMSYGRSDSQAEIRRKLK